MDRFLGKSEGKIEKTSNYSWDMVSMLLLDYQELKPMPQSSIWGQFMRRTSLTIMLVQTTIIGWGGIPTLGDLSEALQTTRPLTCGKRNMTVHSVYHQKLFIISVIWVLSRRMCFGPSRWPCPSCIAFPPRRVACLFGILAGAWYWYDH